MPMLNTNNDTNNTEIAYQSALDKLIQELASEANKDNKDNIDSVKNKIVDLITANAENFIYNIDLPVPYHEHRVQIELDNFTVELNLAKNIRMLSEKSSVANEKPHAKKARTVADVDPKIEVTLYEEAAPGMPVTEKKSIPVQISVPVSMPSIKRTCLSAPVVTELLALPGYQSQATEWQNLFKRSAVQKFIENLEASYKNAKIEEHPLSLLLECDQGLKDKLGEWTKKLNLTAEQYHALLDVYNKYGKTGLEQLFNRWDMDSELIIETANLITTMPTFLPFLDDASFIKTIHTLKSSGEDIRSWWKALIKNYKESYQDLTSLYRELINTVNTIRAMNLTIPTIESIKNPENFLTTLKHVVDLLNKCASQDRAAQLKCIHEVDLSNIDKVYFVIPDMSNQPSVDLEHLKTSQNPQEIRAAVYNYIAKQKYHLPLEKFKAYLERLISQPDNVLGAEAKCKMAYLLAQTTSTNQPSGLDVAAVTKEWKTFSDSVESLETFNKMVKNNFAINAALIVRTLDALKLEMIKPLVAMHSIPPMSFLNKAIKCSEYKFLGISFKGQIPLLQEAQNKMMSDMANIAELYQSYPAEMMQAITFINTKEIVPNKYGKYEPNADDSDFPVRPV
jgi:hypothetical protein